MIGPGKYDDTCTIVREMTNAVTAVVVIIDGNKGSGFSLQTINPVHILSLAEMLENIAKQLRADAIHDLTPPE
jgi:hypothetical protein